MLLGSAVLRDALDRHFQRRAEGTATLSVLVGPPERALESWNAWAQRQGLQVVLTEHDKERAMVTSWAEALARHRSLVADAEALVAKAASSGARRALSLPAKTTHERRVLLETLSPSTAAPGVWELCRHLLEESPPPAPGALPEAVRDAIAREPLLALQSLLAIAPLHAVPALRIRTGPSVFQRLRTASALCAAAPTLTVACVLSPEAFEDCMRQSGSRVRAMMREGRLDVEDAAARATGLEPDPELLKKYRSKEERYLHEQLSLRSATAGLFEVNATVDPRDGYGPREVDLLCRELRLAVEIDGFHHFRTPEDFRRDQRKSVALQRAGYLVVRYLADDVVARLEEILNELDTLIDARRREVGAKEEPHGHH